jgi:hypothetical protein
MFGPLAPFLENLVASWVADAFGPTSMTGIGIAIISVMLLVIYWHGQQRKAKKPGMASWGFIIVAGVVTLLAVGAFGYGLALKFSDTQGTAPTRPPDKANYDIYSGFELSSRAQVLERLGKPISQDELMVFAYQAGYEKASMTWSVNWRTFYILSYQDQKWQEEREPNTPLNPKYWNPQFLKKRFPEVPKGKFPPYSGIAKFWEGNPEKWSNLLGWREWHASLPDVHRQEFENGIVIGPILSNPNIEQPIILMLYRDNQKWDHFTLSDSIIKWTEPIGPKGSE